MVVDTDHAEKRDTRCHRPTPPSASPTTSSNIASWPPNSPRIGLIHSGSVTRRYTRCATPGCKCHADPPQPHGPYYQWTAKINGKTVTRRLNENEAKLYQEWIANDRQLRRPHPTDAPGRGQSRRAETQTSSQPVTDKASPQHAHTQPGLSSQSAPKP